MLNTCLWQLGITGFNEIKGKKATEWRRLDADYQLVSLVFISLIVFILHIILYFNYVKPEDWTHLSDPQAAPQDKDTNPQARPQYANQQQPPEHLGWTERRVQRCLYVAHRPHDAYQS